MNRVVITGMGAITPIGNSAQAFWDGMMNSRSGAGPITQFDIEGYTTTFACEVKDFDAVERFGVKDARKLDRFVQFSMEAADEAIANSGLLNFDDLNKDRVGVIIGSGIGGMITFEKDHISLLEKGPRRVSPHFIPMMISDIAAGQVSIKHGLKGPNFATVSACSTASHAIGTALMMLQLGHADAFVAGGSESTISGMAIAGFNSAKALSTRNDDPQAASRPFDKDRDGFVMGEGAGIVVLETLDHAKKRGANILAELTGFAFTGDAYHVTSPAPGGEGAVRSMKLAIENAGLKPEDIDYINAHGTSTGPNDENETAAIKTAFGQHAYKLNVSSTKSMTGHLLGAAGAVESIACINAIREQIIPPTINHHQPDEGLDLNYTALKPQKRSVRHVLNNVFGFGGHNATLIFSAYEK
ncbi:MAG: beta-ketoacyl-ACP synthase II [Calditrichaeota bacterium]|nr:beta-ketoacyl-ACP synthase II [Calditrichota bacterium]